MPNSFALNQPDYQTPTSQNPFLQTQVNIQANSQTCTVGTVQKDYIMVLEADAGLNTITVSDSASNTYTTPSYSDYTQIQLSNSFFGSDMEYNIFFAVANSNQTNDIITLSSLPSTEGLYCATIGNRNTTGWESTPALPIFVIGNSQNTTTAMSRQFGLNSQVGDYASGLSFTWLFSKLAAQSTAFTITPNQPFIANCFVGAPATCSHLEEDSGSVSFNWNIGHSIGGENTQNLSTVSFPSTSGCLGGLCASKGVIALISFPTVQSCLPSTTQNCVEGNVGINNTPTNFNFNAFFSAIWQPLLFIVAPSFIFGIVGLHFKAGIYGYVIGALFGSLTGVIAQQLFLWEFLVMLFGVVVLFVINNSGNAGEVDISLSELEG